MPFLGEGGYTGSSQNFSFPFTDKVNGPGAVICFKHPIDFFVRWTVALSNQPILQGTLANNILNGMVVFWGNWADFNCTQRHSFAGLFSEYGGKSRYFPSFNESISKHMFNSLTCILSNYSGLRRLDRCKKGAWRSCFANESGSILNSLVFPFRCRKFGRKPFFQRPAGGPPF